MSATSKTDLTEEEPMKTKNELAYFLTMRNIKKMLDDGIITRDEYKKMDEIFTNKYKPVLSKLPRDIDLI